MDDAAAKEIQDRLDRTNEKELTRLEQIYRYKANGKYAVKVDKNKSKNLDKNLEFLKKERRDLKKALHIATGSTHVKNYEMYMEALNKHVACQENIKMSVDEVLRQIGHIKLQLKRLDQDRFRELQQAISEHQYNLNLEKAEKTFTNLENSLDVARRQEHQSTADNVRLRSIIAHMMQERELFSRSWHKMVEQLSHDKKFLIDMVERAVMAFNQGAELCTKLDALRDRGDRTLKSHVRDMLLMIQQLHANEKMQEFLGNKGKVRALHDLEVREYRRRDMIRTDTKDKNTMYENVLDRVKRFCGKNAINSVVLLFDKADNEYFANFTYMTNLNAALDFLNSALDGIYSGLKDKRIKNNELTLSNTEKLNQTIGDVEMMKKTTDELVADKTMKDAQIDRLFKNLKEICVILECDTSDIKKMLADTGDVTPVNVQKFLSILEVRLNAVINVVYSREKPMNIKPERMTVRGIKRNFDIPSRVEDIVLVQQCAECAETEDVNRYDEEIVLPLESDGIRSKVRSKIVAPEMQFRLHNISKCRLPRSRAIVNKRYQK